MQNPEIPTVVTATSSSGVSGVGDASYWEPVHLVPSAWREHAAFGYWLVSAMKPQTIVELGTHNGYSFFVFAEAARRLGLSTRLSAIDSWRGDDQAGFYGEDVYQSVAKIAAADYAGSTELIRAYFSDAVSHFDDGSIDLLHIDGRHGYDDVKEDFEIYLPKLSARAVVVFHDTQELQAGFGVHRFWAEISQTAPSFEFHHGHGLGVLVLGENASPEVREFATTGALDPRPIRAFYENRGAQISARFETDEARAALESENANLRRELLAYGAAIDAARTEINGLVESASWRITAPLRVARRLGARRG